MKRILLILLALAVISGCGTVEKPRETLSLDPEIGVREYPSLAMVERGMRSTLFDFKPIGVQPEFAHVAPIPGVHGFAPYAFIVNNAPWDNFTWGKIYFSDGLEQPKVIFDRDGMSVLLKAGYVWFIEVENFYLEGVELVIESRPGRISIPAIKAGNYEVEWLAETKDRPAWNYIVAEHADAYAFGRTGFDLRGSLHVFYHGQSWVMSGSYLMPDMDGGLLVYCSQRGTSNSYGQISVYAYDLSTRQEWLVHKVPDSIYRDSQDFEFWEAGYAKVSTNSFGWCVVHYDKKNGGALDNVPYMDGVILPQGDYRWVGGISIKDGKAAYVAGNYNHAESALIYYDGEGVLIYDTWSGSYIDPWCNVGSEAILYSKFNNSLNRVCLDGYISQISRYGNKVRFITSNLKASAM